MKLIILCFLLALSMLATARIRTPAALSQHFINWDGGMRACKGADNKMFNLEKLIVNKVSRTKIALMGDATLAENTTTAIKFVLVIKKEVNGNYEYLMTITEQNLCTHIGEKGKPWTPFVNEMGISGCPIPAKTYTFKHSTLDASGFPLSAAQAGNYRAEISMFENDQRTVCLLADVVVQQL